MYLLNQPETLLEKYPLQVHRISRGRGMYICQTDQGDKLLLPFYGSKERAHWLASTLDMLYARGIVTERILRTSEGECLVTDVYDTAYICKDMFAGDECRTRNLEDMKAAARALAHFQNKVAMHPDLTVFPFPFAKPEELWPALQAQKRIRELRRVRNYIRNKKKKTAFEEIFQRESFYFLEAAEQTLAQWDAFPLELGNFQLCHGDFNQHNVVCTPNGWQLIHFERMQYQLPMVDLANFLRKMMEKHNWKSEVGKELLYAYTQVHPLRKSEGQQLYLLLSFPQKFWKIANHYQRAHKAWILGHDTEKLSKVIAQESMKQQFVEELKDIVSRL